ncbi:hypothetical protein Lesp02_68180 [Lentzea sp. NBRC 105346]|nr:hypothetical protein Lesp02_68180 [Lentzea sp. NBRC 105346]
MPIPGSPETRTATNPVAGARSTQSSTAFSSGSRPTSGNTAFLIGVSTMTSRQPWRWVTQSSMWVYLFDK